MDTVIAELTQGQPYRHVMGYELNEPKRAQRDAKYNTALRTGEYPLRTWKWDRARALAFLKKIFGVDWIKSACVYPSRRPQPRRRPRSRSGGAENRPLAPKRYAWSSGREPSTRG